jgi:hypothetical protein
VTETPTPPPPCPEPGVRIYLAGEDAAMGLRFISVGMINCGTKPVDVNGHPGVRVLDKDKQPEPVTAANGTQGITTDDQIDAPPKPLTLQPGEKAMSGLIWRNTTLDGKAITGTYFEVTPLPGAPAQIFLPTRHDDLSGGPVPATIDLGTTGKLGVGPWSKA